MAEDYSTINQFPTTKLFTVSANTSKPTKVILPATCVVVEIGSESGKIYWSHSGVDDTSISSDKAFVLQNNYYPIHIGTGKQRRDEIYIVGSGGSEIISVILREK